MRKKTQVICLEKGEDAFYATKKCNKVAKSKVLKIFGAGGLALIMGIGALCGVLFAPVGNSGSAATSINSQNTELGLSESGVATAQSHNADKSEGLIMPQENDPVIFTTDSGIDIKFALASVTINSSLSSGNLSGFPYFTTTGTGGTYTWVIIGVTSKINEKYFQLSSIKGYAAALTKNYFSSCYETTTPAGAALETDNLLNDYVYDYWTTLEKYKSVLSQRTQTDEIPNGCVLCLANASVMTEYLYSSGIGSGSGSSGGGELTTREACSLSALGLTSFENNIIPTYIEKRAWDGSVSSGTRILFDLGAVRTTFNITTYLTAEQRKLSSGFWTGDSYSGYKSGYINTSGNYAQGSGTYGIRPAFVLLLD